MTIREVFSYHEQKFYSTPSQRHVLGMVLAQRVHDNLVMHHAAGECKKPFSWLPFPASLLVLSLGQLDCSDGIFHCGLVNKPDSFALVVREMLRKISCCFRIGGLRRSHGADSEPKYMLDRDGQKKKTKHPKQVKSSD